MDEYDFIIARDIELGKRLVHQANILNNTIHSKAGASMI